MVYVLALDARGGPVIDLTPDEFRLVEDEKERTIRTFLSPEDAPLEVALLFDTSSSVSSSASQMTHWTEDFLLHLRPDDCVLPVFFGNQVRTAGWMRPDDAGLGGALREFSFEGGTALYDAILEAQAALTERQIALGSSQASALDQERSLPIWSPKSLFPFRVLTRRALELASDRGGAGESCPTTHRHSPARQAIVVVSDARDTASTTTFTELLLAAALSRVPIFAAGITFRTLDEQFNPARRFRDRHSGTHNQPVRSRKMKGAEIKLADIFGPLAAASGGALLTAPSLREALSLLLNHLKAYYVIGYDTDAEDDLDATSLTVETARADVVLEVQKPLYGAQVSTEAAATAATTRGFLHLGRSELQASRREFERAIGIDEGLGVAHYGLGITLHESGHLEEARESLRRAVWLAPWLDEAFVRLAVLSAGRGDADAASRYAQTALQANPAHHQALSHLKMPLPNPNESAVPLYYLLQPRVPDIEAQLAIIDVLAALGRQLVEQEPVGLASKPEHADYALQLEDVHVRGDAPRRVAARVAVIDRHAVTIGSLRLEISSLADVPELDAKAEALIAGLRSIVAGDQ